MAARPDGVTGEAGAGAPPQLQSDADLARERHRPVASRTVSPRRPAGPSPGYRAAKAAVFLLALAPLAWIAWQAFSGAYVEPIDEVEKETGRWALRLLLVALALTPVRRLTGWGVLAKFRRMLGLFVFFYATVHLAVYAGLDMELNLGDIVEDAVKHPRIWIGLLSWALLLPLALTSTKGWIRRLGGARWNRLHQLVYVVAVTATIHYLWAVKLDTAGPYTYAALFAILLGVRAVWALGKRRARAAA